MNEDRCSPAYELDFDDLLATSVGAEREGSGCNSKTVQLWIRRWIRVYSVRLIF